MHSKNPGRILLLVDDSAEVCALLADVFGAEGYQVLTAANGADALTIIESQNVDVILTDLRMPVMDGFELAMAIKADSRLRDIPIVLLSATPMKNTWAALEVFSALLVKPCPLNELIRTVNDVQIHTGDLFQ
ncbi:response regulator [Herbaspirillum seropedicae]|uniref:response regulator n=1 Tax=Herbaspirillum seropedicae TaxID=964 RepID=UPI003F8D13FE